MTSTSVKVIWADFGLIFNPCAQDETRTHTESKFESYFFSLTINQLVSNFKYHFTLGRFGQILGHFLSIQKRVQRYKKYLTCANFKA